MKILLTGAPKVGKTTLVAKFLQQVPNKQGFITREILEDGDRVGFELVSSLGQRAILAHKNIDSKFRVSRYGIDVLALDDFIDKLPPIKGNNLLYIDEIAVMEIYSNKFKKLVVEYLDSGNSFLGTIKDFDNEFANQIRSRPDVRILEVTPENRSEVTNELKALIQ